MIPFIAHVGVDKNGVATGGTSAALSSDTVCMRPYYNKGWTSIYRNSEEVALKIYKNAESICENDFIEYNPLGKVSAYDLAKKNNWDIRSITEFCKIDNVSFVVLCVSALGKTTVGLDEKIKFRNLDWFLINNGFSKIPFVEQKTLKRGDILVGEKHAAVVISDGENIDRRDSKEQSLDLAKANKRFMGKEIAKATARTSMQVYSGQGEHFIKLDNIKKNDPVYILERCEDGWFKIFYPYTTSGYAYIRDSLKTSMTKEAYPVEKELPASQEVDYEFYLNCPAVNLRSGPGKEFNIIGNIKAQTKFKMVEEFLDWGRLNTPGGWIKLSFVRKIEKEGAKNE